MTAAGPRAWTWFWRADEQIASPSTRIYLSARQATFGLIHEISKNFDSVVDVTQGEEHGGTLLFFLHVLRTGEEVDGWVFELDIELEEMTEPSDAVVRQLVLRND